MTSTEFQARLQKLEMEISKLSISAFIPIMSKLNGELKFRIFNNGQATDGTAIGSYSTTQPEYADIDAFAVKGNFKPEKRKRAVNKGKSPGAKGTLRTTIDLLSGYSELREIQGFQNNYVDLSYSGSLFTSIQVGISGNTINIGFISSSETKKARGNEKHFGKQIFFLSMKEKEMIKKEVTVFIKNMVNKILIGN